MLGPFPLNLPHLPVIAGCDFIHFSHKGCFQSPEEKTGELLLVKCVMHEDMLVYVHRLTRHGFEYAAK